jgi:hypothetical protein
MSDKAKIAVVLLTVLLVGFLLASKQVRADPAPSATGSGAPILGQAPEQEVLDRFIGNWGFQATITTEGNPKEKHQTGTISYTRVLGGRFVQERGEDSERYTTLLLYTYDEQRKCYCYWFFSSGPQSTEAPSIGKWDEAAHALNWTYPAAKGTTAQHRFISDDAIECSVLAKNDAGSAVFQAEYKLTRMKDALNPSQPATATSAPVLGQTAEQKVLDRLLGTWSQETTDFKALLIYMTDFEALFVQRHV